MIPPALCQAILMCVDSNDDNVRCHPTHRIVVVIVISKYVDDLKPLSCYVNEVWDAPDTPQSRYNLHLRRSFPCFREGSEKHLELSAPVVGLTSALGNMDRLIPTLEPQPAIAAKHSTRGALGGVHG